MRNLKLYVSLSTLLVLFLLPGLSLSQHSFASNQTATLQGTVKRVWFKNPHVRYLLVVTNNNGVEEVWDARGSNVDWLTQKGWSENTIRIGDTVSMYGYLGKDGAKALSLLTVTLSDGTLLVDRVPD